MSQHCAVSCCQRTDLDLFDSPTDASLLKHWQTLLEVDDEIFRVCSLHFESRFIETRKVLRKDAIPVVSIASDDGDVHCDCCCKQIPGPGRIFEVDEQLRNLIRELLNFEVARWICTECKVILTNFHQYKHDVIGEQKSWRDDANPVEIKEEPDIAEVLIKFDPFADHYMKEEPQQDVELRHEPEVVIEEVGGLQPKRPTTAACLDCGATLPPNDLIQHRIQEHSSKLICDVCHRAFRNKNSLLKHIRRHLSESDHKCDQCSKTFVNKKELIAHNNRCHSNGNSFVCDHCENIFPSRKEMVRCRDGHYARRKSAKEVSQPCPICKKRMRSNSIYSHIKLVHNNERDQICQVCGKALKTSYDLKVHLRTHSGERPEICEHCGKTFISYAQLYKHRKVRHMERESYQCEICLKNVLSRFKLKCHVDRFHPNGLDNGMRADPVTNCYHCKICPLKFVAMHKYEKHLLLNDCQKFEGLAMGEAKTALKGEFKCQECGSILITMKGLKKHIRFVHPKEPQTCTICSKQLKNPHTLWQHMTLSHKQPVKRRKL